MRGEETMADLETLRVTVDASIAPFKKKMKETQNAASDSMHKVQEEIDKVKIPDKPVIKPAQEVNVSIPKPATPKVPSPGIDVSPNETKAPTSTGWNKVKTEIELVKKAALQAHPRIAALAKVLSTAGSIGKKGFGLVATAASKTRAAISKVSGVAHSLINKFRSMASAVKGFASSILGIGKNAENAAGKVNILKKAVSSLVGIFALRTLFNFGKDCINLGSDLAEVQNVVDNVFPNMKNQVGEWATSAAEAFGLSETMAKKYTGTFGAMAKSFGFSESAAYEMSTTLAGLTGDVASFYNLTQDESYTKMKSVFTGETESLKELGIVMTQSALDSFALANGFGQTTKNMTEAEKVSLRYAFVQKQLATASGDFARTSNGWANQVRILSLQFESLKATIGQGLINAFTPVIKVVNILIGRVATVANAFKALTAMLFGDAGGSGAAGFASDVKDATDGLSDATDAANGLADATTGAGNAATEAAKKALGLMGFDKINKIAEDANSSSNGGSSGSGGAGGSIACDAVDYGTLDTAEEKAGSLGNKMASVIEVFQKAWDNKGQDVINRWKTGLEKIKTLFGDIGETVIDVWTDGTGQEYLENILELAGDVGDLLGTFAESLDDAWNDDDTGKKYITSIFNKWNALLSLIDAIADSLNTVWGNGTGERIMKNLLEISTNMNNTVANLATNFEKAWKKAGLGDSIIQGICDIIETVSKHAANITKSMEKWSEDIDFEPLLKSIDGLLDSLNDLVDVVGVKVEDFFNDTLLPLGKWTIEEGAPKAIDKLSSSLEKLSEGDFKGAGADIGSMIGDINKSLKDFTGSEKFSKTLNDLATDLADLGSGFVDNLNLSDLGTAISNALDAAMKAVKKFMKEFDWAGLGEQIGGFITGIDWGTLLADVGGLILEAMLAIGKTASGIFSKFGEKVSEKISDAVSKLGDDVTECTIAIKGKVDETFNKAKDKWEEIKEGTSEALKNVKADLQGKWSDAKENWNKFKEGTSTAIKEIKGDVAQGWEDVKTKWEELKDSDIFKSIGLKQLDSWTGKIRTKWTNFTNKKVFKHIGLDKLKSWDKGSVRNAWKNFKSKKVFKKIGLDKLKSWTNLKGKWDSVKSSDVVKSIGMKALDSWDKWKDKWDAIKNKTVKLSLKITEFIGDVQNWANNNIIIPLENKLRGVTVLGKKIFSGVTLPRFAQGAYLGANSPVLAMVGDNPHYGEFVAPENKMQAMADRAAENAGSDIDYNMLYRIIQTAVYAAMISANKEGGNNVNVTLEGDMDAIFRVVVNKIRDYTRIHGRTPFPV